MREAGVKEKGALKTARLQFFRKEKLPKPAWIRVRAASPGSRFHDIKQILREQKLHTVCEEASCPNIAECFGKGTATFMILGDICTRRCPFCDVAHGRPLAPDPEEPRHLADTIAKLKLSYVVITSVDRDDLKDGGARHFVDCIRAVREKSPTTTIEVLVPDFRGRLERALEVLPAAPPDVMNHNMETVPRLYKQARPGGDYAHSLKLLQEFKRRFPAVPTKSGLMVGLGETDEEILLVMRDLRGAWRRNADDRAIPRAFRTSPAGGTLRASRHLRDVRARSGHDGIPACGDRPLGPLVLSRRPAGPSGGCGRYFKISLR